MISYSGSHTVMMLFAMLHKTEKSMNRAIYGYAPTQGLSDVICIHLSI